ncbi:MAG TPA: BTAD domain-containing putative transcriptional regulator [Candidatus Limnocylindrales bacterium]
MPDGERATLELLDRFRLVHGRTDVDVPRQSATILAFLAVQNRPVHRSLVAGTLWADLPEHRALADLRSALYRIRVPVVRAVGDLLELRPGVRVDFHEAMELARALSRTTRPPDRVEPIVDLLARELLPDSDSVWIEPVRERYRHLRLRALETVARCLSGVGRHGEAIEVAQMATAIEPMSETAEAALILAFVAEGNEGLAIREHESFRRRLWRELRVRPRPFEELRAVAADAAVRDGQGPVSTMLGSTAGDERVTDW